MAFGLDISDDAPDELKNAVARRNECSITGHCPCGAKAELELELADGICNIRFEHSDDCPVPDDRLLALCDKYGWSI